MEIIFKKIDELIPYENNPRINDKAAEAVANSINEFGFKNPIIIDGENVIIAGHTRLKAAKKLKLKTVPCLIADDLTDEQIKAFRLADNKTAELADWDIDLLATELQDITDFDMRVFGFDDTELEDITQLKEETQEDDFDEKEALEKADETDIKRGVKFKLGWHILLCGDATSLTDMQKLMQGETADLLITDPPYNVNYEDKTNRLSVIRPHNENRKTDQISNDNLSDDEFYRFLIAGFERAYNVLKQGGVAYIFHADIHGHQFREAFLNAGFKLSQCLIWVKNHFVIGRSDYQWRHEPILYGWKEGASHYFTFDRSQSTALTDDETDYKKLSKAELIRLIKEIKSAFNAQSTVQYEDKPLNSDFHPTTKPIKLVGRLMANSSVRGETVLDSFGGSGSTLIAAEQLGRNARIMELDPLYCYVIIQRWEQFTGHKAERIL